MMADFMMGGRCHYDRPCTGVKVTRKGKFGFQSYYNGKSLLRSSDGQR